MIVVILNDALHQSEVEQGDLRTAPPAPFIVGQLDHVGFARDVLIQLGDRLRPVVHQRRSLEPAMAAGGGDDSAGGEDARAGDLAGSFPGSQTHDEVRRIAGVEEGGHS